MAGADHGLPFHRLDGGPADPPVVAGDPLTGTGCGLWFHRARWYEPSTGRFLQADLNETALPLITALVTSGEAAASAWAGLSAFDPAGHYADGLNLYGYLHSNPIHRVDPLGLDDPFDDVDLWSEEYVGNILYAVGTLNEVVLGLQTALWVASAILPGSGLIDVVYAAKTGVGGFWGALSIGIDLIPGAKIASIIGKAFKWKWLAKGAAHSAAAFVDHHTIPKAVLETLRKRNKRVASQVYGRSRGRNRIIWRIPADYHVKVVHAGVGHGLGERGGAWNTRWDWEIEARGGYANVTADDIYGIRDAMARDFDLERFRPQ